MRRAYTRAVAGFLTWCKYQAVPSITTVQPLQVAALAKLQIRTRSVPTVKLRLMATCYLFDWMIIGRVVPLNPADAADHH